MNTHIEGENTNVEISIPTIAIFKILFIVFGTDIKKHVGAFPW
jgi:ABC-type proline/glycine betaine transport system permease subunit